MTVMNVNRWVLIRLAHFPGRDSHQVLEAWSEALVAGRVIGPGGEVTAVVLLDGNYVPDKSPSKCLLL